MHKVDFSLTPFLTLFPYLMFLFSFFGLKKIKGLSLSLSSITYFVWVLFLWGGGSLSGRLYLCEGQASGSLIGLRWLQVS